MKRKNFVNLTPHLIVLKGQKDGIDTALSLPPSGEVARVKTQTDAIETLSIDGVEIAVKNKKFDGFDRVENIPLSLVNDARIFAPEGRTIYIVTSDVFDACGNRADIACVAEESAQLGSLIMKKPAFPNEIPPLSRQTVSLK